MIKMSTTLSTIVNRRKLLKKNCKTWETIKLTYITNCYQVEKQLDQNRFSKSNTVLMDQWPSLRLGL